MRGWLACLICAVAFFGSPRAFAHPIDLGALQMRLVDGDRLQTTFKLHAQTAAGFIQQTSLPDDLAGVAPMLFSSTLGEISPQVGGQACSWREPSLEYADSDRQAVLLKAIALCPGAVKRPFSFEWSLPFLRKAPVDFRLMAELEGVDADKTLTTLANKDQAQVLLGEKDVKGFMKFLTLGVGHIGALPGEWFSQEGEFQLPEGLDHIFFVLALVLSGGTLAGLLKSATGFTVGHSLTLGLSAFSIIHVHSHWVEAFIALSIAWVAALALFKPNSRHGWLVAGLFGMVHGLGFASVLHDMQLQPDQVFSTLLGFNLGVELGQVIIIAATLPCLMLVGRWSSQARLWTNRGLALGLFLMGSYWFLMRAIG